MSSLLGIGTSGMLAQNRQMEAIGNNLANSQTTAYRSGQVQFADTYYSVGEKTAAGQIDQLGNGVGTKGTTFNWEAGGTDRTNKETHAAITNRKGMFVVDDRGEEKYSRAGDFEFSTDSDGDIVMSRPNGAALKVDDGSDGLTKLTFSEIPSSVSISPDGKITVPTPSEDDPDGDGTSHPTGPGILAGGTGSADIDTNGDGSLDGYSSAQIKVQAFGNPDSLKHEEGGLYVISDDTILSGDGIPAAADGDSARGTVIPGDSGTGTLQQGYLEQSNVDMVKEFADIISTQRAYQGNSKTIQTADVLLEEALRLKR